MRDVLREQLGASRERLLSAIQQPDLTTIAARATARRRRRRTAAGAAVLVLAAVVGFGAIRQPDGGTRRPPDVAASGQPAGGPIWTDRGITINGLPREARVLPGDVYAVEFATTDLGYLLARDCADRSCRITFAATDDGGLTWTTRPAPFAGQPAADDALPVLLTLGDRVAVVADGARHSSGDGGRSWVEDPQVAVATLASIPTIARPYIESTGGCELAYWTLDSARPRPLSGRPDLTGCWAAPNRSATGAWWVAGRTASGPALAVSRDDGVRWELRQLPDQPGAVRTRVATLGSSVYAVVLGDKAEVLAVYRGADADAGFQLLAAAPTVSLVGDLVPLLDGRVLFAGGGSAPRWYVSQDGGGFGVAAALQSVGRLARTATGYVAYNLFGGGWCAYSSDGSTWRKLNAY